MRRSTLNVLVEPRSQAPLELVNAIDSGGEVVQGTLRGGGREFAIVRGIPRMVEIVDAAQGQTQQSFGFKWQQQHTFTSPGVTREFGQWQVRRYGFGSVDELRRYFGSRRRILDAGCGGGLSASVWMDADWNAGSNAEWYGVDISEAIDVIRQRLGDNPSTQFVQADLMELPFRPGSFDTVFSEGVLHHTPSTRAALASIANMLAPDGEILFYVYRKKAPLREFADDWVREHIAAMPPEQAWDAMRPLTALARALAELRTDVEVPEDIPYLGIKAGRYDVQRLLYWHVLKLYWNEAFSFDENNHVNFDWYHPRYAHRQTEDDVRRWCDEFGLDIVHFDAQESGFTVRALKRPAGIG